MRLGSTWQSMPHGSKRFLKMALRVFSTLISSFPFLRPNITNTKYLLAQFRLKPCGPSTKY